jgi:hypothetical protein
MASRTGEQILHDSAEVLTRNGEAAKEIVKGNAEALADGGAASRDAIFELTKAYQELATRNARNLTVAMQAMAAVKSPAELIELQQRLTKEALETAVRDGERIRELTTAVFTAAFEPIKKRVEAAQDSARP